MKLLVSGGLGFIGSNFILNVLKKYPDFEITNIDAELNGANLLFSEDVCRIMYAALDEWYEQERIFDFNIVVEHMESLHNWSALAITSKFGEEGLR